MSWEEAMKEHPRLASQDRPFSEANVARSTTSNSWDPHEVWLTRVKQPRERASSRLSDPAEIQGRVLPD